MGDGLKMKCTHHCWHKTNKYPMTLYVSLSDKLEYQCCWCGKKIAMSYMEVYEWLDKQHGKHVK